VNGVSFAVTSNLASALRQIRKVFGEVLLWADAICTHIAGIPQNIRSPRSRLRTFGLD
jgi:hypothetical protein